MVSRHWRFFWSRQLWRLFDDQRSRFLVLGMPVGCFRKHAHEVIELVINFWHSFWWFGTLLRTRRTWWEGIGVLTSRKRAQLRNAIFGGSLLMMSELVWVREGFLSHFFSGFATICSVEDYLGGLVQRNFVDCWGNSEFFFIFSFLLLWLLLLLPPTWVRLRVIGFSSLGRTGWSFLFPSLLQGPPPKCFVSYQSRVQPFIKLKISCF